MIPSGWRHLTPHAIAGGDKSRLVIGPFGSNLRTSDYRSEGVPLVFVKDIRANDFSRPRAFIDQEKADKLSAHVVLPGDVLITKMGEPPGDAAIYTGTGTAVITADCIRLRPARGFDPKFVAFSMQAPQVRKQVAAITSGVAQQKVSLGRFRSGLTLGVPTLQEQRRIVEIIEDNLSRLDAANRALITSTARARALIRATLMRAIPDVTEYPSHWLASTVDHAGSVTLGRQRHPDWHTGDNMQPYLRVANVFEDRIDTSDVMQMHWPEGTFERFRLVPGDILLNEGQTPELLGRPAMYRGEPGEVAFTNSLLRFQANALVNPEFALIVFRRHMHAGRFTRESRITTNIAHLSATRLKPIEFPIPPLDEQERIVREVREHLGAVGRFQEGVAVASLRSRALRRAVLAAAFSGRLTGATSDGDLIEETADTLEGER